LNLNKKDFFTDPRTNLTSSSKFTTLKNVAPLNRFIPSKFLGKFTPQDKINSFFSSLGKYQPVSLKDYSNSNTNNKDKSSDKKAFKIALPKDKTKK